MSLITAAIIIMMHRVLIHAPVRLRATANARTNRQYPSTANRNTKNGMNVEVYHFAGTTSAEKAKAPQMNHTVPVILLLNSRGYKRRIVVNRKGILA
ncbi:hypothetical protein D3C75_1047160 [compost metagenome]